MGKGMNGKLQTTLFIKNLLFCFFFQVQVNFKGATSWVTHLESFFFKMVNRNPF